MIHEPSTILITLKNLGYIPAVLLGLSTQSYIILLVFMTVDMLTGITRSYILHGGRAVKSYKFVNGITTKILIILIPLLLVWAGKGSGYDLSIIAEWTLGMLILAELYSILGNIYAIKIREDIHEFDAVAWVLGKLRFIVEGILKNKK